MSKTNKEIYEVKKEWDFQDLYIDVEEWRMRELSDGCKVPYLYVHGGFEKKAVKFVFCFPEKSAFKGRFFQYLSPFPGPDEELASLNKTGEDDQIGFCLQNGAYFVESNMGSKQMFGGSKEPSLVWKSSAAVAEYSRIKAMELYECERPYGYVHGGSGGAYKTIACIENTNAWDGAVPYVIGSPVSLPNTITLHAQGQRTLRRVFGKIVDSLDAGGSGNMYDGLTEDEAEMLREITGMGFPPRAWFLEAEGFIYDGSLPVQIPHVKQGDAQYFEDFWTAPGYLGADPQGNAARDRLQFTGVIKEVHVPGTKVKIAKDDVNGVDSAWKKMMADGSSAWIELEEAPRGRELYLDGVTMEIQTGAAKGTRLTLGSMHGNCLVLGMCFGISDLNGVLEKIRPGDVLTLDNSDYIAIQSYYRHQVPKDLSFHAWDQFRDENGKPKLPQRKNVMGYDLTGTGTVQDGCIQGKVIVIQSMMDESTCPWCGDWYRNKVIETKGNEDDFRIYYMDRCMHGNVSWLENNMVTNYLGAMYQSLLDVSDWVERGIEPCRSTNYRLEKDGQVYLADTAKERKGLQPIVSMTANGTSCAEVKAGEMVVFRVKAEVPDGAGDITAIDYDFVSDNSLSMEKKELTVFKNKGEFSRTLVDGVHGAISEIVHTYERPGTYFASARVKMNRSGDDKNLYTQIKNIARVRIIVTENTCESKKN